MKTWKTFQMYIVLTFSTPKAMDYSYQHFDGMQYAWSSHLFGKSTVSNVLADGTGLHLYGTSFHQVYMVVICWHLVGCHIQKVGMSACMLVGGYHLQVNFFCLERDSKFGVKT